MQHSNTPKGPVKLGLQGLASSIGLLLITAAVIVALLALYSVFHHG